MPRHRNSQDCPGECIVVAVKQIRTPKNIETHLANGMTICLRPIRPSDEQRISDGIESLSDHSRYMRFFSGFRSPPPSVLERLTDVDGEDHIAWGMINLDSPDNEAIAAARVIRDEDSSLRGEFSVAVLDAYQKRGVAQTLLAALFLDARSKDFKILHVSVLRENRGAQRLVEKLGGEILGGRHSSDPTIQHYEIRVDRAFQNLTNGSKHRAIADIISAFAQACEFDPAI